MEPNDILRLIENGVCWSVARCMSEISEMQFILIGDLGPWSNILLFSCSGKEWEMSEKKSTSQLFFSFQGDKSERAPKGFTAHNASLSLQSSFLPLVLPSLQLFLLGSVSSRLPVGTADNKHRHPIALVPLGGRKPRSCAPARTCHDNEYHLFLEPATERTCSGGICRKINTHTSLTAAEWTRGRRLKDSVSCPDRRGLNTSPSLPLCFFPRLPPLCLLETTKTSF